MKRYNYSQTVGIMPTIPFDYNAEQAKMEVVRNEKDNVLDIVFAPDTLTGRPRSDLGTYMSENCNPLVRDFIERNLRTDFSTAVKSVPAGIEDEDIIALTRNKGETVDSYVSRVNHYMKFQKQIIQNRLAKKRQAAALAEKKKVVTLTE